MWIMTPFGILMPAQRPEITITDDKWRDAKLQIRVRDRRALVYLRKNYMGRKLGPIIATPDLDYDYRSYCTHDDFAAVVARMVIDIDYAKFKPEAIDDNLHHLYNRIWAVVSVHYGQR